MPKSYYICEQVKSGFKIEHGLDPRSCYPRCDFCPNNTTHTAHGTVQLGRWWAHAACATAPENTKLATAKLPKLDYSDFSTRETPQEQLMAMRTRLREWTLKRLDELSQVEMILGASLMRHTTTEYL